MRNSARAPIREDRSEISALSFMLGFAGLLFVAVVGFGCASETSISTSAGYGYDEALETQTSSLSPTSHGVCPVKLDHFCIVHAPRLDPKREPVSSMQP